MLQRIIGVLRLDVNTFEEIEHDESATGQAAIIIAVIAILQAIGGYFGAGSAAALFEQFGSTIEGAESLIDAAASISPVGAAIQAFVGLFVTWVLWSALTFFIGTRLFAGKATMGEMLRVIGFAMVPQILGIIPCIGILGWIYSLVTGFIGIRQGLDLDNGKTAATLGISFLVALVVNLCVLGPLFTAIM
jgi:hypothetical protein